MIKHSRKTKNRITVRAYAKVNLSLDVLRKLPDGYHEVEMVMQAVELYDKVTVEWEKRRTGQTVQVSTNLSYLPVNEDNIACKAARLMIELFKPKESLAVKIHLEKHIPVAAGLAGGSSNGAAVLRALAKLWGINLTLAELCGLGERLGADVPFCLWAQEGLTCALAKGLGTQLSSLPPLDCLVLLSKPPISVSTAKVYGGLKLDEIPREARPDTARLIEGLEMAERPSKGLEMAERYSEDPNAGLRQIAASMNNLLETVTLAEFPRVVETKNAMLEAGGAAAVMMSGSGPTVFGLYEDEEAAHRAYAAMKKINRETYLRRTYLG